MGHLRQLQSPLRRGNFLKYQIMHLIILKFMQEIPLVIAARLFDRPVNKLSPKGRVFSVLPPVSVFYPPNRVSPGPRGYKSLVKTKSFSRKAIFRLKRCIFVFRHFCSMGFSTKKNGSSSNPHYKSSQNSIKNASNLNFQILRDKSLSLKSF